MRIGAPAAITGETAGALPRTGGDIRMQDFFIALRADVREVRLGKYPIGA